MSQTTVLVIDDSATIRKMVDSHLSQVGYNVVLATNAEEGLQLAPEVKPDLILLDHQLPGTTGIEMLRQLIQLPGCAAAPVVVASTLRKRAYAEYMEVPNVVDSLHKPFTPDLLKTTVANALETGAMVIQSQTGGTAVPEVMQPVGETALNGSFKSFTLREVLDFLNNSGKKGMVEVAADHARIWFFLESGRIQAVVANAVDPAEVADTLPETLQDLAPLLKFTLGGEFSSQVDGLVELLNKKVLDPRMLRALLRHQAAYLALRCFRGTVKDFTFEAQRDVPPLFRKIPLDISLAALLVEAALTCPDQALPQQNEQVRYVRHGQRGQNLDRTGLTAQHMKILGYLADPVTLPTLAQRAGLQNDEVRRVLYGFQLAEWVQSNEQGESRFIVALEPDRTGGARLRELLNRPHSPYTGKVVRDRLGIQLLVKRNKPDAILVCADSDDHCSLLRELRGWKELAGVKFVGIVPPAKNAAAGTTEKIKSLGLDATLERPYIDQDVLETLGRLFGQGGTTAVRSEPARESRSSGQVGGTQEPQQVELSTGVGA
jgi:CheY-like chemotaxis protein